MEESVSPLRRQSPLMRGIGRIQSENERDSSLAAKTFRSPSSSSLGTKPPKNKPEV